MYIHIRERDEDQPLTSPNGAASAHEARRREAAFKAVHAEGRLRFPLGWPEIRHAFCKAITGGRTDSSKELTADELLAILKAMNEGTAPEEIARDNQVPAMPVREYGFDEDGRLAYARPRR